MHQEIGDDFTQDTVPGADALDTIQVEGIVQMLFTERHEPVIAFDQIGNDHIPVVITVGVKHPENSVRFVLRQHGHDGTIMSEQQDSSESDAFFLCPFIS